MANFVYEQRKLTVGTYGTKKQGAVEQSWKTKFEQERTP